MKVLIIQCVSSVAITHSIPLMRSLKKKYNHSQIHYLSDKKFEDQLKTIGYIDKILLQERDLQPLVLKLLPEKFDVVLDLQKNHRSWYVKSMLKQAYNTSINVKTVKGNPPIGLLKFLKRNANSGIHQVDRFIKLVKFLDVQNDGLGLEHQIPEEDKIEQDDLPMSHSAGYISFVIGGPETRKLLPEQWKELASLVDYPIVLQGDLRDNQIGELIKSIDPIRIYNSCGKFNYNEGADILRFAKVVVSGDNEYLPLAGVYKRKTVSVWGSSSPELSGRFPYYGYNNMKTNKAPEHFALSPKISCHPCNTELDRACPKGHYKCMRQHDMIKISEEVMRLLNSKEKARVSS